MSKAGESNDGRQEMIRALKDGQYDRVLALHEELVQSGQKPDLVSVNCVIGAKAAIDGVVDAKGLLAMLTQQYKHIKPNALTYAQLFKHVHVGSSQKEGDKEVAAELLEEMAGLSIAPTIEVYNELIGIYCAAADYEGAEALFGEMRSKEIHPSKYSFYRFINGCFKGGQAEHAYQMLQTMEAEWRVPDVQAYERMQAPAR